MTALYTCLGLPSRWRVSSRQCFTLSDSPILNLSLAITSLLSTPLNTGAVRICERIQGMLDSFETDKRLAEETPVDPGEAGVAIFGMGRVGSLAYDTLCESRADTILAIDHDVDVVAAQLKAGRNIVQGDPSDSEFMARLTAGSRMELVLLATGELQSNLAAIRVFRSLPTPPKIAATANWPEDAEALREAGADTVFCVYAPVTGEHARTGTCLSYQLRAQWVDATPPSHRSTGFRMPGP